MDITELKRSGTTIKRHPWEMTRSRVISFLLKKERKQFNHIADFGSGDVYILNELARHHTASQYSAIDTAYDDEIVSKLENTSKQINFFSTLKEFKKGHSQVDLTLFLDVLEHCEDDKKVLQEVINSSFFTTKEGYVLITVPAFQSLFSQHDYLLGHYRRYNQKDLIHLCRESGLTPVHSGYFFFSLLPVRLFQLALERLGLRKTKKSIDNWKGNALITRCIRQLLWIDFKISRYFANWRISLPGLSCYCICKKSPNTDS